jgi:hypothetical protein
MGCGLGRRATADDTLNAWSAAAEALEQAYFAVCERVDDALDRELAR